MSPEEIQAAFAAQLQMIQEIGERFRELLQTQEQRQDWQELQEQFNLQMQEHFRSQEQFNLQMQEREHALQEFVAQIHIRMQQISQELQEEKLLISDLRSTQALGETKLDRLTDIVERFIDASVDRIRDLDQRQLQHEERMQKQEQISERLEMLLENLLRRPAAEG
ncbi:MAG: hypothetical protein HC921_16445 [Synechococcaceae cyanobacterium SM2_3_1]|nr:hypothetical protein [Synechococcaceae cyanobacterium SM2_3_1]